MQKCQNTNLKAKIHFFSTQRNKAAGSNKAAGNKKIGIRNISRALELVANEIAVKFGKLYNILNRHCMMEKIIKIENEQSGTKERSFTRTSSGKRCLLSHFISVLVKYIKYMPSIAHPLSIAAIKAFTWFLVNKS